MDTRQEGIARLREIVQASKKMVFFGGAGVSTGSGIPDFRSQDGLYRQRYKYPPEQYEDAIDTVISQCEMWTDNYEQQ